VARALVPFLLAPPAALLVIALLGGGTAAAIVGLVVAGAFGGAGAWLAFGRGRPGRRGTTAVGPSVTSSAVDLWISNGTAGHNKSSAKARVLVQS
jgi:hypothetical protein